MKLFIYIYTTLNDESKLDLQRRVPPGSELIFKTNLPEYQQRDSFKSTEILMGNPPFEWFQTPPSGLKFWQLDSAGFDRYKGIRLSIPVANMGVFFARKCAETMVGGILAFYRGIHHLIRLQLIKEWKGKQIRPTLDLLGNKRVLILGSGAIGLSVKYILEGFGCTVKTTARQNPIADFHSVEEVLNALPGTDLVINSLPGTAKNYVSSRFFDAMHPGSVYASVGRGNTTDEQSLIAALESGKLAGAVLDVTEKEPLPQDNPLWLMENVILTQHTGGGHKHEEKGKVDHFISNLNRFLNKEKIEDQIELCKGY
jgi:glyoxylate/hydroxypyruvate reductase